MIPMFGHEAAWTTVIALKTKGSAEPINHPSLFAWRKLKKVGTEGHSLERMTRAVGGHDDVGFFEMIDFQRMGQEWAVVDPGG